jgi:predicted PurR-regulated permease PerM
VCHRLPCGPHVIAEAGQVAKVIPQSVNELTDYLDKTDWGRFLVATTQRLLHGSGSAEPMSTVTAGLGTALEDAVVILVIGLYGALNARGYTQGILALVPQKHRPTVAEVSERVVYTLRWWVIGQLIPMVILGVATMFGLWCLGVPLAFVLGLFTGAMIFIPYMGSWLAFVPTVLVSFTKGTEATLYVVVLYILIHAFEGYVLTPLVQKRTVLLPPVLTILSQFFLWKVSGPLGVALATPLAAAGLVLIKTLYLHEEVEH